ncbi:hypothetical protein H7Y29_01640 [Microbacteriaceae bacterium]|nr:hypothetical protein [Candidatus Saccharibacteria bacterium]
MSTGDMYDDFALERLAKEQFGITLEVDAVIVRNIDVGHSARATVFLTTKKQLFCYISGPTKLLLGDAKKIAVRMGLKVEMFFPPKGQPQYFDTIGQAKFKEVFPGRHATSDADIVFYRTLAPYNPALLQISEVKDGLIYQADTDARGGWRQAAKFAYRRIKTS